MSEVEERRQGDLGKNFGEEVRREVRKVTAVGGHHIGRSRDRSM